MTIRYHILNMVAKVQADAAPGQILFCSGRQVDYCHIQLTMGFGFC